MSMPAQSNFAIVRGILNDRSVPAQSAAVASENDDLGRLCADIAEIRETLKRFANGNFDQTITIRGAIAGYLKTLQANMRHLSWQAEQVAAGDFSQRVDFMGDFSRAFNTMTVRMEQLLKDERERERQLLLEILECCPICFAVTVDEKVRFATPFMKQFLGIELDERLIDFFATAESCHCLIEASQTERTVHWCPVTLQTKSGETKEMLAHLFSGEYHDEPATMVWLVDVTQIRQVEWELRQARDAAEELARMKGDFLANMSHEIRTPMNAIIGMTHLLRHTDLSEKQSVYVGTTEKSAKLLLRIINDILDFSKIEAGKLEMEEKSFSLPAVFQEALSVVRESTEKKQLRLLCDLAPDLPRTVIGDSVRFIQILLNLLNNAIKFTSEGSVRLKVRINHKDNDAVILLCSVADSGIGIAEEHLNRLFMPFMQADNSTSRRYGGTGLGLAICKNLIEIMGGTIWCESRVNEGTTFYFTVRFLLPAYAAVPNAPPSEITTVVTAQSDEERLDDLNERRVEIPEHLRGIPILLVDDNKVNRLVAAELLTLKGFTVDMAANGRQAVEKVGQKEYGLVLMDIQMPEMDGFQATRVIRQNPQWADLPILAMTANTMAGDRELCLEAGMNEHISKPIDPTTLYRNIVEWAKPVAS